MTDRLRSPWNDCSDHNQSYMQAHTALSFQTGIRTQNQSFVWNNGPDLHRESRAPRPSYDRCRSTLRTMSSHAATLKMPPPIFPETRNIRLPSARSHADEKENLLAR